jgi:hypothetical protein
MSFGHLVPGAVAFVENVWERNDASAASNTCIAHSQQRSFLSAVHNVPALALTKNRN